MTYEEHKPWRKKILLDLQDRNRRQCDPFAELIKSREYLWYVTKCHTHLYLSANLQWFAHQAVFSYCGMPKYRVVPRRPRLGLYTVCSDHVYARRLRSTCRQST